MQRIEDYLTENRGLRLIIEWFCNGEIPRGLSDQRLSVNLGVIFRAYLQKNIEFFQLLLKPLPLLNAGVNVELEFDVGDVDSDRSKRGRVASAYQDSLGSRSAGSFLAVLVRITDVRKKPWVLVTIVVGCVPFEHPYTTLRCLESCQATMGRMGIEQENLLCVTQDTTAASINTYRDVKHVVAMPCFCHEASLFTKHVSHESTAITSVIKASKKLTNRFIKNSKSAALLKAKQEELKEPVLKAKVFIDTRWGAVSDLLERMAIIMVSIKAIDPKAMFIDRSERNTFLNRVTLFTDNTYFLAQIQFLLKTVPVDSSTVRRSSPCSLPSSTRYS
jgi:hypothetical protein